MLMGCQDNLNNDNNSSEHQHIYSDNWYMDSEIHWKECECGNKAFVANHPYGSDNQCVICQHPLYYTSGLTFTLINDGTEYEVTGIDNTKYKIGIELIIPKYYNGKLVTSIGELAFDNERMYIVQLPDSINYIGRSAFAYCSNLTSINLPENCKSIGRSAFISCYELVITKIPDSVTFIGDNAFRGCFKITEINLSKNINVINENLFLGCANLININIPEGITIIKQSAFLGCGFSTIKLPKTLEKIEDSAFRQCIDLQEIELPDTVETIGWQSFVSCSKLKTVKLSQNLRYIGREAFKYCESLTAITIPENILYIGASAFLRCSSLNSATFENPYGWVAEKYDLSASEYINSTTMSSPGSAAAILTKNYYADCDLVRR